MNGWIVYLDTSNGPLRPVTIEGRISLIEWPDGTVREVVVEEADGSAAFINARRVVAFGEA